MRVIVDGVRYQWTRIEGLENWDAAFQESDRGKGWIETYKRKGGNSYTQISGDKLTVIDEDIPLSKSGGFYVKVRNNYRVGLRVRIDKGNYWDSGGFKRKPSPGRFNFGYASLGPFQFSDAFIVLESGDALSIDIDGDYDDVAQFKVVQGGQVIFNGSAINRNVSLKIDEVRVLRPEQDEVQGPLEGDGQGDLDRDGVIDSKDFDPYDPDIQKEGDIDDDPFQIEDDEAVIIYDQEDIGGYEIYVSPNLKPDPFPFLGYLGLAAFFSLILRGASNG